MKCVTQMYMREDRQEMRKQMGIRRFIAGKPFHNVPIECFFLCVHFHYMYKKYSRCWPRLPRRRYAESTIIMMYEH